MAILGEMDGGPAGFYIYGLHSLVSRLRSFFAKKRCEIEWTFLVIITQTEPRDVQAIEA